MLRARVRPEVVAKLDKIADRVGVPRSTVVAYAIGEYAARMSAAMGLEGSLQESLQEGVMDWLTTFGQEALDRGLGPEDGSDDD